MNKYVRSGKDKKEMKLQTFYRQRSGKWAKNARKKMSKG